MTSSQELRTMLSGLDRKSYPAYKALKGAYSFGKYILSIDHVQGDPFAAPSAVSVRVSLSDADFPGFCLKDITTKKALADYLLRQFERQVSHFSFQAKGSGKSGLISVTHCGQEVLSRTACEITDKNIILRFYVGFPANGRSITARELDKILFEFLPVCVQKSLYYASLPSRQVEACIWLAEDQQYIRSQLSARDLVAFVADGAALPRESGISQKPMKNALAFSSPDTLKVTMELPHAGKITGMGIPKGITLIVGGGYHGKSTLLTALQLGVYDHIAGDGREYVITDDTALKLRSEDGRFIKDVDISMFINDLPNKKDTHSFCTEDASGSTSQAAGIIEGMEAGSRVFLLDEDTSATNFMVRDAFMQQVIHADKEPITPFLSRARDLYEKAGISTILVAGSSGAFFHIADTILQMDNYKPVDITASTKALCKDYPLSPENPPEFVLPKSCRIMTKDPEGAPRRRDYRTGAVKADEPEQLKCKTLDRHSFLLGKQTVDLRYIEQLADYEQTASLGLMLKYAVENLIDEKRTVSDIVRELNRLLCQKGLSAFADRGEIGGGYALPRMQELYSCLNRYRRK